jgi:ornithine cyclodeaminase
MSSLVYLSGADVEAVALSDREILAAVRDVLAQQGRGETVIEPRTHLFPRGVNGHFNVLRGVTAQHAGVKVVGDFVDNHRLDLPSELALLLLMDPATGMPAAIIDATAITEMRTGAVTAIGAELLARHECRRLGHIGARGTAYWNVRLLVAVLGELEEIRVHSRRSESRAAFARRLEADLGRPVVAVEGWEECVRGADVVVEASRLVASTANRMDLPGGAGDPLWDGERGPDRSARCHGQDSGR